MECKRLPIDYEIGDFTLKIIVLIKNSGLIISLEHQKTYPMGRLVLKMISSQIFNLINTFSIFINSIPVYGSINCEFS